MSIFRALRRPRRTSVPWIAAWLLVSMAAAPAALADDAEQLDPAPEFELLDLDGNPHALSDYRGQIVLLDFWATWCSACIRLMDQQLTPLYNEFGSDDRFQMISIGTGNRDTAADQKDLAEQRGYEWLKLHDANNEAFQAYGARALPHAALIDEHGNLVLSGSGYQLIGPMREYLVERLAEDDLEATAGTAPVAPPGAQDEGGGTFVTQVVVFMAVLIIVIILMTRDGKKKKQLQQLPDSPPGPPEAPGGQQPVGGPGNPAQTPPGAPSSPPSPQGDNAGDEDKPRTNFMGGV